MNRLLRSKHWQLFIILTCTIFISIFVGESGFKIRNFDALQLSSCIRVFGVVIFFLWLLILGLSLNNVSNNPYKFKSGIFIAAIIICAFGYINMNLALIFSENYVVPEFVTILSSLLTLAGLLYVFYNLPKSLKSLETNKEVNFGDCIADMFLLFAFPIGVWFTQPRINKLFINS